MALLDEIGKGISGIGRKTAQMSRDFSDTSRLNSMISEEERNVQNCYLQIGKLYVDLHKSDYEPSFATWIQNLNESERKIADYKQQVQVIKGVRSCPGCGADVQRNAAFCNACGTRMPVEPPAAPTAPADSVFCSSCGAAMPRGTKFCTACGTKLEQPAPAQTYAAAPAPVAPAVPVTPVAPTYDQEPIMPVNEEPAYAEEAVPEMFQDAPEVQETTNWVEEPIEPAVPIGRFCSNCGAQLQPEDMFCTECGTKYE